MRHDNVHHALRTDEPDFDLPPQLQPRAERRLAQRAAAAWSDRRGARLPGLETVDLGAGGEFAAQSVLIDLRSAALELRHVGTRLAATFGLGLGPLPANGRDELAARLREACDLLRMTQVAVPVEGALAGTDCACLLTRGVLMPIGDANGRLAYAHGVFSWKQVLDAQTSAALRRELTHALSAQQQIGTRSAF